MDVLAAELGAVADRVTVILPWGSLLKTVAAPDMDSLRHVASLCRAEATLEIVFSYDKRRDAKLGFPLGIAGLDEQHVLATLPRLYEQAGFGMVAVDKLPQRELVSYETTWAKRLAFGRSREVWCLQARTQKKLLSL